MNFYEFSQNNSGGEMIFNKKLTHRVFIEARNAEKAKEEAIKLGVYFQGVDDGEDCPCCGDRWSEPNELIFPYRYGTLEKNEAEKIADKYKADLGKTTWKFLGTHDSDPTKYDVIFRDVESYAQFITDKYGYWGWSNKNKQVEARIFYKDKKMKEIISTPN